MASFLLAPFVACRWRREIRPVKMPLVGDAQGQSVHQLSNRVVVPETDFMGLRPDVASILSSSDVWDMTIPAVTPNLLMWIDVLARCKRAGWTFVSLSLQDWPTTFEGMRKKVERFKELVHENADWLKFGTSLADVDEGRIEGKLVVGIHSQETRLLEHDLSRVRTLHDLGVKHMLLAYNVRNLVADGCAEVADAGLSNYGRDVVREMNRVGIIVDGSHTGRRSSLEAIDLSERPMIFSHSGARAVHPHIRNIDDDQIRACASRGGAVGVVGLGTFLGDPEMTSETMFRHIDHIATLVGAEHVGIGTDFVPYYPKRDHLEEWKLIAHETWPDPAIAWPGPDADLFDWGYFAPEQLPEVIEIMLDHGYSVDDVRGVVGGNFKRVYATADSAESPAVSTPESAAS